MAWDRLVPEAQLATLVHEGQGVANSVSSIEPFEEGGAPGVGNADGGDGVGNADGGGDTKNHGSCAPHGTMRDTNAALMRWCMVEVGVRGQRATVVSARCKTARVERRRADVSHAELQVPTSPCPRHVMRKQTNKETKEQRWE